MCRRGSNHILTMDTQEGRKVGAGLRRLAWQSKHPLIGKQRAMAKRGPPPPTMA